MLNKKGIVTSPADLMKGFLFGLIIGAIIIILAAKDIGFFAKIPFI